MIKRVEFQSIDELFKNVKISNSKSFQLKKGPCLCYFSEFSYKNRLIHNIYTDVSTLHEGINNSEDYMFILNSSHDLQKFKGQKLNSNSILIIRPKEEYSKVNFGANNTLIIYMKEEEVKKNYGELTTGIYNIDEPKEAKKLLYSSFQLFNCHKQNSLFFEYFLDFIIETIHNVMSKRSIVLNNEIKSHALTFYKIKSFMEKEYKSNMNIIEIADYFKITDRTLRNLFCNHIGISPKQFQKAIKINYLKRSIIENPNSTISKILEKEGMGFQSYVIKDFKDYFNMTPKQFRNNCLKNNLH